MPIASINPATGELLREFTPLTCDELETKLGVAQAAFRSYRHTSLDIRAQWLSNAARILETDRDAFARTMTAEMGKPLKSAAEEVAKCAWVCRHYAENAARMLASEEVETTASRSFVCFEPIGPVLAVMPWNFPFWQVFRFAAPTLMAGNAGLLKHASNVPQCALAIEDIFRRAGFPHGAFQTLLIESSRVARVIEDNRIAAVTLTGSEPAGRDVAARAGAAIKKTVLELGGSDPFIVMPSADVDEAARTAARARAINNGQSCIAAKRFIAVGEIAAEFESRFVAAVESLRTGDPMDETTDIGPLATLQILEDLAAQVSRATAAGARVLPGGNRIGGHGFYFEPTVLAVADRTDAVYREEFFGPVALLFRAADIGEAIAIANETPFGLGASVWTADRDEQEQFIAGIESGMVFVNGMVVSDPRLPFGGVKQSGYGRELGTVGIREFVSIKTVWIR